MYCLEIGPSHQYGIPLAGRQWPAFESYAYLDIAFGCSKELSLMGGFIKTTFSITENRVFVCHHDSIVERTYSVIDRQYETV